MPFWSYMGTPKNGALLSGFVQVNEVLLTVYLQLIKLLLTVYWQKPCFYYMAIFNLCSLHFVTFNFSKMVMFAVSYPKLQGFANCQHHPAACSSKVYHWSVRMRWIGIQVTTWPCSCAGDLATRTKSKFTDVNCNKIRSLPSVTNHSIQLTGKSTVLGILESDGIWSIDLEYSHSASATQQAACAGQSRSCPLLNLYRLLLGGADVVKLVVSPLALLIFVRLAGAALVGHGIPNYGVWCGCRQNVGAPAWTNWELTNL